MESLLKKFLEKKRSERSSSGESSTSPDAKKAKSGDVNFPEVEEHEADDEIFREVIKTTTLEQDPPNHKIVGGVCLHPPCLMSKDGVFIA